MATTVVSSLPLQTTTQQQIQLSSPPADRNTTQSKFGSSRSKSPPSYTDKASRRASLNRYSWSSASSTSSTPSPTSPNKGTAPTRKFRLPVRVSTDLTSFASSDSSPQSRRQSLSLASDSKRRSSQTSAPLKKVDENSSKDSTEKSTPKSPEPSPLRNEPSPPPAYNTDTQGAKIPPPAYQDIKPKETSSPTLAEQQQQPKQQDPAPSSEKPVAPSPAKPENNPAPRTTPTTIVPIKMSSAASSPDAQKAAMANPMANRGLDFSVGNGNTKLTHQSEQGGSLPLPNLSGRGNGPVGNLLRGPVDDEGNLKAAALTVGIKLDLEAEVHLSARVRGDILVGLY